MARVHDLPVTRCLSVKSDVATANLRALMEREPVAPQFISTRWDPARATARWVYRTYPGMVQTTEVSIHRHRDHADVVVDTRFTGRAIRRMEPEQRRTLHTMARLQANQLASGSTLG